MISTKILVRLGSAVIDIITIALTSLIISIPSLIIELVKDSPSSPDEYSSFAVYEAIILFTIFLNKDLYFGRSLGKRFTGLRVFSAKSGQTANPIRCAIRNLFSLLWPLEGIILIFSPESRIGDLIAGTRVKESGEVENGKFQVSLAIGSIVVSFVVVYALFKFIDGLGIMN